MAVTYTSLRLGSLHTLFATKCIFFDAEGIVTTELKNGNGYIILGAPNMHVNEHSIHLF